MQKIGNEKHIQGKHLNQTQFIYLKTQTIMKKNLILLCSLFMATALISSCAQDAMEPEVDAAATGAETRAYGDKTPKVMRLISQNGC